MTKRIFRSILLVAGAVLLASIVLIMGVLYGYFGGVQERQMEDELTLAVAGVETDGADYLKAVDTDRFRLTWVAADGTVLYDTQADAAQTASGKRPETPTPQSAPEPPKPKIKKQKTVSIKSINTSNTWQLESADDVRRYVSELQDKLMRALEKDTVINIEF